MAIFEIRPTGPIELRARVAVEPPPAPQGHLAAAEHLAKGLAPLMNAGPECAVPLAFLAAQVAESALKSFLARTWSKKQLTDHKVRHNLAGLWVAAYVEGLGISPSPPGTIAALSSLHSSPYPLRYAQEAVVLISTVNAEKLCRDVESLLAVVNALN